MSHWVRAMSQESCYSNILEMTFSDHQYLPNTFWQQWLTEKKIFGDSGYGGSLGVYLVANVVGRISEVS